MAIFNIIKRSSIKEGNNILAEHYQKERLNTEILLEKLSSGKIKNYFSELTKTVKPSELSEGWRVFDLPDTLSNFLTGGNNPVVDNITSNKKIAQPDNFIVSRLRYYLKELAIVPNLDYKIALSTEYLVFEKRQDVSAHILLPFTLSDYVQSILKWAQTGNAHPRFASSTFKNIPLPDILIENSIGIEEKINLAINQLGYSNKFYEQATQILDEALGLNNIQFKKEKSYKAYASEIASTRRMNAEFFSPTVKEILKHSSLTNANHLGAVFQILRGSTPKKYYHEGIPVIKTKNIRIPEIDEEKITDFTKNTVGYTNIIEGDLLLASMGVGSLGRMSFIHSLDNNYIVDGTIRVLRRKHNTPNNYQVPTLLFLTSTVGQKLIYRGIVGSTGIISLPDEYLKKLPLPNFPPDLCEDLTNLVIEAITAKRKSNQLLEQAKNEVETLIEKAASQS